MQQYRDTNYAAVSAALHAREARLLTRPLCERMLEAPTAEESAKALIECGYPPLERCTLEAVEAMLARERAELYREAGALAPDKRLVEFFELKYDYHNAKLAVKARLTDEDVSRLAIGCGRYDASALLRGERGMLSSRMGRAMARAEKEAEGGDVRAAELTLDRACFEAMSALAGETGNDFLIGYAALQIDAVNLRTLVRTQRMGASAELLSAALLPGGHLPAERLRSARGARLADLTRGSALAGAGELAAAALNGGSLTAFERACDDALMQYLQRARRTPFGPEVVVGYLSAKEAEFTAVRTILSGKLAGLAAEDIRARLRLSYL